MTGRSATAKILIKTTGTESAVPRKKRPTGTGLNLILHVQNRRQPGLQRANQTMPGETKSFFARFRCIAKNPVTNLVSPCKSLGWLRCYVTRNQKPGETSMLSISNTSDATWHSRTGSHNNYLLTVCYMIIDAGIRRLNNA